MRFHVLPALVAAAALAQAPGPVAPDTVVATIDGKPVTAAELQGLYRTVGPQVQQNAAKDPAAFLRQYAMLKRLSDYAEKQKLDQQSPYREALAAGRMQILYQAAIQHTYENIPVSADEQKKFYEANHDRWVQARVKVIYIPFSENPAAAAGEKKPLSEKEARAKAENIVKQLRAGADFVKMVREHSEDPASASKDGDFPPISKSDQIPDAIKQAVFALKKGQISDPVRAPNGFYIFRAEEITAKSYDAVRNEIFNEIKLARLREFLDSVQKGVEVRIENEAFFRQPPATQGDSAAPR